MRIGGVGPAPTANPAPDARAGDDAKLRGVARQLTGLFAQQLFKAMRDTVPHDEGAFSGGSGEEMFTGMLDEHVAGVGTTNATPGSGAAGDAGAAFTRGLADAVYRRLRGHVAPQAAPAEAAPAPSLLVTPAPAAASLLVRPSSAVAGPSTGPR